ncbi:MAG TPA: MMPL family transporter [Solirubrobacteraceae bacterium]|jgi:RND superfamily putative drug exporter|nr:MMPL family transporter [Solirubrobacteraceae bacterium]
MHNAMERFAGFVGRRSRLIVGIWAVLFVVSVPLSMKSVDHLTEGGFVTPGSGSATVDDELAAFDVPRFDLGVLLARRDGSNAAMSAAIERAARGVAKVDNVSIAPGAVDKARAEVAGKPIVILAVSVRGGQDQRVDAASALREELGVGEGANDGVEPYLVGQDGLWAGLHVLQKDDLASAERIGFPITLLILLAVFGTLAAAALPVVLAAVSVTMTGAAVYFLAQAMDMSVFVTNAASMIGIGVAIDYSLFILARYREELRKGNDEDVARAIALRTSGLAVVFSGVTVVACLLGLLFAGTATMRSMAIGMVVVVAISMLGAVTLLPALIKLFGRRVWEPGRIARVVERLGRPFRPRDPQAPSFWARWSRRVMGRPVLSIVAASAVMLLLAVPALSIHLGESAIAQFPPGYETREGMELAGQALGAGALGPVQLIATFRDGDRAAPANRAALDAYVASLRQRPAVVAASVADGDDPRRVALSIIPREGPETASSEQLVQDLRDELGKGAGLATVATVQVGGATALTTDFIALIEDAMPEIAVFIVILSYLILLVMLRSVLLPLKAVLMTLLSVAAAYGVIVAVFQWGWLDGLLGYESPGSVEAIAPPLLLAIVFGLSMDYEVFLLSRIREARAHTDDDREAVARGLTSGAGTVTSAALIMVSVFAAFALVGVPSIKMIGLGLAVAIALDATIVRLILVPATMELMGRWNWWMPRWLERLLPPLDAFEPLPQQRATRPLETADAL